MLIQSLIRSSLIKFKFFFFISLLISQEIPNEFYEFSESKILSDNGYNWKKNTTFGPVRYENKNITNDSLRIHTKFGSLLTNRSKCLFGYGHFTYKKYFHGYLYPRIVTNPDLIQRYSGIPRDISRGGFNSGETDISGITYQKDWMTFQFGRGRQSWGAGNDIQLAISEESPSYDYGLIDLNFSNLRVRYFHGYLESDTLQINRYINGRGIEWKNNKNLLIGISEIAIYSGPNRNIDFAYINPITTHLEIELNKRQNFEGTDKGNGVWQLSIDYLTRQKSRISFNYMFDEITLDKSQRDTGKEKFNGFSFKVVKPLIRNVNHLLSLYCTSIMVGKNTFRHEDGNNNFVQRNKPLGHPMGSHFNMLNFGINSFFLQKLLSTIEIGIRDKGLNTILMDPYNAYDFSEEKSSYENKLIYLNFNIDYWYRKNMSIFLKNVYIHQNNKYKSFESTLGINIIFETLKTI